MKLDFARESALKILYKIEEENGYSNLVLDEYLEKEREKLTIKDINLISEIVYGTVSWKLTIDTILEKYSKIKLNKIAKWVKIILRMGIYQIVFLDKIPKRAAVNESVNLCKKYGYKSVSFVNAILRKVEKSDYEELRNIKYNDERISKMYSMPKWIVEKLIDQYGIQKAEEICKNSNLKPKMTIRVNTLKITKEELKEKLEERNIACEEGEIPNFLYLKNIKNVSGLDLFKQGLFTVQDEGAGKIGFVLNPQEGEHVLDVCSAPGGKTTHLAEIMKNKGHILAWDIHSHRVNLVKENASRLGISIIEATSKDALEYEEKYDRLFDKILLDVPCMGLGVIKRKPDIKWQKKEEEISEIKKIQESILRTCSKYLKTGGELVYSTCSILKEENEEVIQDFIKSADGIKQCFEIVEKQNILPQENTDGFFICKLRKNN
ncbi:MAG: 16S rRNA (cytosine(967)-C(5))-methyltransferase RsmB [Clostridia bacterium]|nr:16S rRNA (cytosine(967)-C(5))-methyltransferase RsmB [Clostridia bacterium]